MKGVPSLYLMLVTSWQLQYSKIQRNSFIVLKIVNYFKENDAFFLYM